MAKNSACRILFPVFLFSTQLVFSQHVTSALPRSTPEAEGVSSTAIMHLIDALDKSKNELHSMMLLRHGKVIAEGWWAPYSAGQLHNVYSVSKSLTATAVGFALADGLLHRDDKVISYFPRDLPDTISANLKELSIRDLLTMSVGMEGVPPVNDDKNDSWIKIFLAYPLEHKPGVQFFYNPMATYMLSAIVQHVTGTTTYEYLNRKLFRPLGIQDADWTTSPQGITCGGWGLRLTTEDMAKFGQLYLQKGGWSGKQLLLEKWIQDATTGQIIQHPALTNASRDSSDWEQGYGYQFWRGLHNSYRADGSWGQFILVMPDQDAVLVITEETSDPQSILNIIWKDLLPAMKAGRLPENTHAAHQLRQRLASLELKLPEKDSLAYRNNKPLHHVYAIAGNDAKISSVSLKLGRKRCALSVRKDSVDFNFRFAFGKWQRGTSKVRGLGHPAYFYGKLKNEPASKVAGTYYWTSKNTVKLILQYTESLFKEFINRETITLSFEGDKLLMEMDDNRGWKAKCIGTQVSLSN